MTFLQGFTFFPWMFALVRKVCALARSSLFNTALYRLFVIVQDKQRKRTTSG